MASLLPSRPRLQRSDVMRLINVETMQLHYLPNADIVEIEYATLSHTWGRYEATYQKWHDAQARESDDTKKIRDACKVVKESLGLQWLWADTCCINKADEGEVNEAVNSVFSWYQSSTICLAYLSDVPTANTDNNELLSSQVRNSRWFTRGWTLPELLAPPQLIFYAADWTVLGQRDDSLAELISEITGIDQAYISGRKNMQQASFSKRMSWLSGRRTTLVEDTAYCMLGILGIEMDINYGEEEIAMVRLQTRIEQKPAAKMDSPSPLSSRNPYRRLVKSGLKEEVPGTKRMANIIEDSGRNMTEVDNGLPKSSQNPLWICVLDPYDANARSLKRLLEERTSVHVTIQDTDSLDVENQKVPLIFYRERAPFPNHRLARQRIISSGYTHHGSANLEIVLSNISRTLLAVYEIFFDPSNMAAITLLKLKLEANNDTSIENLKLVFHDKLPLLSGIWQSRNSFLDREEHGLLVPTESQDSGENSSASEYDFSTQSGGTRPSTVPTSIPSAPPHTSRALRGTDRATGEEYQYPSECLDKSRGQLDLKRRHTEEHGEPDTATIYSIETLADDPKLHYFQAFVEQLAEDVKTGAEGMALRDLGPNYLGHVLKEFAWKLHEESSNPFQLETSVIIHRKRRNIVDLLDFEVPRTKVPQFEVPESEIPESESEQSSVKSEAWDGGFLTEVPFRKTEETIVAWIGEVNPELGSTTDLSQMPQYRQFIQESSAYRWLLAKLKQHNRLTCEKLNIMDEIGVAIRNKLKTAESLRRMSRNRAPVPIEMTYTVDWDLLGFMRNRGIPSPFSAALPNILCLTGTWNEAQATTVIEYMDQTWPQSGRALIALLQTLLSALEEEDETGARSEHAFNLENFQVKFNRQSLDITVTGGQYLISEIGEQIAWLVSALQTVLESPENFVMSFPGIVDLIVHSPLHKGKKVANIRASCAFRIDWRQPTDKDVPAGLCWKQLLCLPVLVRGYPILRRSVPKSGLEISLGLAASILGSNQVVQLDDRLLIKGFNMLMIATLVAADIMVWHLFVSEKDGQRISYMDSRLDGIDAKTSDAVSLHHIAGKRHIVGWCTKATDWCGSPSTNHNIRPAGLPRSPAFLKIDKLYIEGGATVIGGLMMDINKKEQPFWLQREKDYPDLLNWVKLRPIVF